MFLYAEGDALPPKACTGHYPMGVLASIFYSDEVYEGIRGELKTVYLQDSRPWCLMFSTGKDSTTLLGLVWEMLWSVPEHQRIKPIHVITSDTKVETPQFSSFVKTTIQRIRIAAQEQGLPIYVHVAQPSLEHSFFYQCLGKGNPPPNERTRTRWCTDKLKIKATDRKVEEIRAQYVQNKPFELVPLDTDDYDMLMLLGVREEESSNRKRSIDKFAIDASKFARHAELPRVRVYHAIKYLTTDDVWTYILQKQTLPWGLDPFELYQFYRDSIGGECPMTQTDGKQSATCGGSRSGCWPCLYVGRYDQMLISMIDNGEESLKPLLRWKRTLYHLRNDIRYREPFRRADFKKIKGRLSSGQMTIIEGGECEKDRIVLGSLTHEARLAMFRYLLYIQQETGYQLIEEEEVQAILDCWREEGFTPTEIDPQPFMYDGALVLHPNGAINEKETTTRNPVFRFRLSYNGSQDEMVEALLQCRQTTGKHMFYRFVQGSIEFFVCEAGVKTEEDAKAVLKNWLDSALPFRMAI
ncbi:DNA sulfur modification protein DndC [Brevibacillus aydinogluensis]|jgi:DNA sulfur modification protein DndC|uniref:phosphoadenosine phosphosulfate reductase domain-containing protein n=1 Tax=Brevibacillus aydinogluensis TaxID=927786 RepID=UPI002892F341|nr:phosphoadenosine phosphosulfate reductase family protein [Brevibacillus aydinogluensis]MDT3417098.1 DNA sulfur modification protein DndC [Brevibacillus aydinogluensis]